MKESPKPSGVVAQRGAPDLRGSGHAHRDTYDQEELLEGSSAREPVNSGRNGGKDANCEGPPRWGPCRRGSTEANNPPAGNFPEQPHWSWIGEGRPSSRTRGSRLSGRPRP